MGEVKILYMRSENHRRGRILDTFNFVTRKTATNLKPDDRVHTNVRAISTQKQGNRGRLAENNAGETISVAQKCYSTGAKTPRRYVLQHASQNITTILYDRLPVVKLAPKYRDNSH